MYSDRVEVEELERRRSAVDKDCLQVEAAEVEQAGIAD